MSRIGNRATPTMLRSRSETRDEEMEMQDGDAFSDRCYSKYRAFLSVRGWKWEGGTSRRRGRGPSTSVSAEEEEEP